jgi:hypothetical protein
VNPAIISSNAIINSIGTTTFDKGDLLKWRVKYALLPFQSINLSKPDWRNSTAKNAVIKNCIVHSGEIAISKMLTIFFYLVIFSCF